MLTERQKILLVAATQILDRVSEMNGVNEDKFVKENLTYDDADQDVACLSEDIRIEFNI